MVAVALATAAALAVIAAWGLGLVPGSGEEPDAASSDSLGVSDPLSDDSNAPASAAGDWRLLAGGDVLMDLSERSGFDPFASISPALGGAELALVNVEMAIATGGEPASKQFVFRAAPSAATTMARAGIDAGSLGNNHALDYGLAAGAETVQHLRSAGVAPVGAGANAAEAYAPATFEIAGTRVAVLGASRVFPTPTWAAGEGPGLASAYDEPRLLAAVRAAKASHDVVIVMVHWGVEGASCPNDDQQRLGAALVRAGASAVLGSHPHVLQPIASFAGGRVIAYSLGNFVWHPRSGRSGETGVLELRFRGDRVLGYTFHPHVLDGRGAPAPASPSDASRIRAQVSASCAAGGR